MRIWSSPCTEASLQRLVGRSGAFEADATLICLWKADEGCGAVLCNSRPLHPPKPPRGAKAATWCGGTGAEGHADLVGEWAWINCFDPNDDEGEDGNPAAADAAADVGAPYSSSSVAAVASAASPPVERDEGQPAAKRGSAEMAVATAASATTDADTDLARSLGWRSVSTAGDEEDDVDGVTSSSDHGKERDGEQKGHVAPMSSSADDAAAATAAGASAALGAYAVIDQASGDGAARREVFPREALLGVLGKLFQQCSVYLAPCQGDPLVESTTPPQGSRTQATVQLQLIRREERALKAIVQPEVRAMCLCFFVLCRLRWIYARVSGVSTLISSGR